MRPRLLRRILPVLGLLLALFGRATLGTAQTVSGTGTGTGTVTGVIRAAPTGIALPYAVIAIPDQGLERFSGADGRFVMTGVREGTHQVLVRRIGFVPQQAQITVTAGATITQDFTLVQIPVRLTSLTVRPVEPCRKPGLPDAAKEPVIAELVGLLRENAATYQSLARQHPYAYAQLRALGSTDKDTAVLGSIVAERIDGVSAARYRPGRVVTTERGQSLMQLPTILDLTAKEFIANHCFHYRGASTHDRETWFALEVRAADRLRSPDVHGTFYLDSATAQLRRMELELSRVDRLPRPLRTIQAVQVRTTFLEIAPGLSVVDDVCAVNIIRANANGSASPASGPRGAGPRRVRHPLELQHVQTVAFLQTSPPDIPLARDFGNPRWIAGGRMPLTSLACSELPL